MLTTLTKSGYNISEKKELDEPSPKNAKFDLRGFEDGFGAMFSAESDNNLSLDGVNAMLKPKPVLNRLPSMMQDPEDGHDRSSPTRPKEFTLPAPQVSASCI